MRRVILSALVGLTVTITFGSSAREGLCTADDLRFLEGLTRDVIDAARVRRGESRPGCCVQTNTCADSIVTPGGCYPSFWIRDFAMSVPSGLFTTDELAAAVRLTFSAQADAEMICRSGAVVPKGSIPDHIRFDGAAVFFPGTYEPAKQGGPWGMKPPHDDAYYAILMAGEWVRRVGSSAPLRETIRGVRLLERMDLAFGSPDVAQDGTELAWADEKMRGVGFGFCDSITHTGHLLFASILRWQAARRLAELHAGVGEEDAFRRYATIADRIAASVPRVFGQKDGWLIASTGKSAQKDVWGTAYAVWTGLLQGEVRRNASQALARALEAGTIAEKGNIRHVPTDGDFSDRTAWEVSCEPLGAYQNGTYWGTPSGWVAAAVSETDMSAARRLVADYLGELRTGDFRLGKGHRSPLECFLSRTHYARNPVYMTSVTCPFAVLSALADKPIVVVAEDNDHYFTTRGEESMTVPALEAYVDRLAGGKVTHFFMCPSGQRTSYDSKAWEPIWTCLDEPRAASSGWARKAKLLRDRGIDIYEVWIRRCRKHGISPWLSPRMNDAHDADQEWPVRNTTFWRTRTDLHCATNRFGRGVLDFSHQEVQDYTFALVKEQLDRYDIDGYELDFMRFDRYFPEDDATNRTHHLDRFVRRVHDYVKVKTAERGHKILLGVRVPTTPRAALSRGQDVGLWARSGWVDWVCASTAWRTPDYNLPVDEWRRCFGDAAKRVKLLSGTDHGVTAFNWERTDMTPGFYAGFADVAWGSGVDGIYLFNTIYHDSLLETICRKGLFPEDLPAYRRRYPVSFRAEAYGVVPDDLQLPRLSDRVNRFRVRLGAKPVGRVSVLVGVRQEGRFNPPVTLNGFPSTSSRVEKMKIASRDHLDRQIPYFCRRFAFPSEAVYPGAENIIELQPSETRMSIGWVEITLEEEPDAGRAKWPFLVIRQTERTDSDFMGKMLELHAKTLGACDEIWFSASDPFCTDAENAKTISRVTRWREACEKAGIQVSVQQGNTLGHGHVMRGDAGRMAASGIVPVEATRDFSEDAWMVGTNGLRMVWRRFCPTSPEVLEMSYRYAKRVLREVRPSSYWLDDDLRLGFYTDEGCFCPRCRRLTKEQQLCVYLEPFRRAADETMPEVRFGLQTVRPYAPGMVNDYRKMMEVLSGKAARPVGIRPGNGHYQEAQPRGMVDKALGLAREAERCRDYGTLVGTVCYEEENYTRKVFNKSPAAIVTECALALASGADTLSVYFAAGGENPDRMEDYARFVTCLAESRPYLEHVAASTRRTRLGGVVAGPGLAVAGVPVGVPESPAAVPWPVSVSLKDTATPPVDYRRRILDALDAATGGNFPVRVDMNHALRILPRIDEKGRLDSVTVLNCSIGETFPFRMRVRNIVGDRALLGWPRDAMTLIPMRREKNEFVVEMPSLPGYQIATVFFGRD